MSPRDMLQPQRFWQVLAPSTRIICTLLLLLAVVFTPNGQWWTWIWYGFVILNLVVLTQVPLPALMRRLAVESAFVGVVVLGTLFREGGQVLWAWGWLKVTDHGLMILGSVTLKALLALLLLNLLTLTTPVPALLQALVTLRVPPLLVAILASMYRYMHVLTDEFSSMVRAANARNLMSRPSWHRLVVGSMIGSLFIRTLERGDRIYRAMLSRGYQGLPTPQTTPLLPNPSQDLPALGVTAGLALAGQLLPWLL